MDTPRLDQQLAAVARMLTAAEATDVDGLVLSAARSREAIAEVGATLTRLTRRLRDAERRIGEGPDPLGVVKSTADALTRARAVTDAALAMHRRAVSEAASVGASYGDIAAAAGITRAGIQKMLNREG